MPAAAPGADLAMLQKDYPAAQIIGLDAAPAMLAAAQAPAPGSGLKSMLNRLMPAKAGIDLVCGDFGALPLGPNSVDLVWSNLALHWHPQPDRVFAEWRRVLRVEGLLMFSNFGPDTFRELRAAFAALDEAPHALPFVDMHDFGDQLVEAGFSTPVMDMEVITVTYDTPQALLADVRALGGNPLATRARGLVGRAAWQQMLDALERQRRPDGKLGLTFEVIYGHAFRPAPRDHRGRRGDHPFRAAAAALACPEHGYAPVKCKGCSHVRGDYSLMKVLLIEYNQRLILSTVLVFA